MVLTKSQVQELLNAMADNKVAEVDCVNEHIRVYGDLENHPTLTMSDGTPMRRRSILFQLSIKSQTY